MHFQIALKGHSCEVKPKSLQIIPLTTDKKPFILNVFFSESEIHLGLIIPLF